MMHVYGACVAGPRHLEAGRPCQDARASWVSEDGSLAVAAVSDGLGSERLSEVGSAVASEAAVAYCRDHLPARPSGRDGLACLRGAFRAAWDAVAARARRMGEPLGEFDATLTLAVLSGGRMLWGQSGDSGLVAGMADGTYRLVTRMQRDEEGRVFPLCFEDRWEFGAVEGVSTALLCPDGVLEGVIAPPVLAARGADPLDRSKARMFLHPRPDDAGRLAELGEELAAYLSAYPVEHIDDDKTVQVVFDDAALPALQNESYYAEPDWERLYAEARAALYGTGAREAAPPHVVQRPHRRRLMLQLRRLMRGKGHRDDCLRRVWDQARAHRDRAQG